MFFATGPPSVPSSATEPACTLELMTGASLVPVTVIVTSWVAVAPWSSVTVTVKVSVWDSPWARAWWWALSRS